MDTRLLRNRPAYVLDRQTAPAMWLVETLWLFHATGAQTKQSLQPPRTGDRPRPRTAHPSPPSGPGELPGA
jgi:hypothetical protein